MLKLAITFLVIGLVAALLGFTGIAGASFAIAKLFAVIFAVLFVIRKLRSDHSSGIHPASDTEWWRA